MKKLTKYIFWQALFTVLTITLVLTCIMWLAQSLRYIEFIAQKGVPILLFLEMIAYLLPNLVVIVAPIALLIGILFIYNKLIADHELVVMQASGMSYWQIAKPAITLGILVTVTLYSFTLYFLPLSFRSYRDISVSLREKSLTSLIQVGQFNTLGQYTVYAKGQDAQGNFLGLLIFEGSEEGKSVTLMAEKGIVFTQKDTSHLLLLNGNRQERDAISGKPSFLYFDRYVIETKDKSGKQQEERFLRAYERYLGDLLNPQENISPSQRKEFIAAAHQRLISPLYGLAFCLLAVCCMTLGHFSRKGRSKRILLACVLASIIEGGALVFLHTLKHQKLMISFSYALLLVPVIICIFLLTPAWQFFISRWR